MAAEAGGGTRLEIEHIARVDDERWAEFGPGAVGVGWEMGLVGLTLHLASGEAVDPAEAAAWMGSEEGQRFVALSRGGRRRPRKPGRRRPARLRPTPVTPRRISSS